MSDQDPELYQLLEENDSKFSDGIQDIMVKWRNINLSVESNGQPLTLLDNISGYANSREILAIMGMSGSGKTSLLSILSNQSAIKAAYSLSGSLKLNDLHYSETNPNRFIRYVPQENDLYDFLTPREHFKFFGSLQNDLPKEQISQKVNKIIQELKLGKVADSIVGNSIFKGLSGGEKKRVSIGLNLISDPSVLILDEPTSGLDSFIALSVIELIKNACKNGITIILTIHQPSKAIFDLIDRVIFMQEGSFVYQGSTKDSISYFESIGFHLPPNTNPSDHFIKILNVEDKNNKTEQEIKTRQKLLENYKTIEPEILSIIDASTHKVLQNKENLKQSFINTFLILIEKTIITMRRNMIIIIFKVVQSVVIGFFTAFTFRDLDYDSVGMNDRNGAMIFIVTDKFLLNVILYSLYVSNEKQATLRNYRNGLYSLNSYFLSIFAIEMIVAIPCSIIFTLIVYWIIGFNDEGSYKVFNFMIIIYLNMLSGMIYGFLASSFVDTITQATFLGPSIATGEAIIGTLFSHPDSLNKGMRWIKYCSVGYYFKSALWKNEFDDLDYDEDVSPEPNSRFGIEMTVPESMFYSICLSIAAYIISTSVFWYRSNSFSLSK